ncbi:hypothetical protein Lfu02_58190 [Longispora fulva]|uniref:Uncharacterized protein n=1 Tax=Longispora fulva TaxID=619741 RepID=A0A8J7GIR1_9ACTN|nr:hypothetical protein [Longispora fulva]MBG6137198.1 hypothetical protein [Longispora fulva]GIG61447.1 hypothetical protein Lfu02_58190 [Longispora fulva]
MSVRLICANPCLLLTVDGERVAFASAWRVDWSEHGSGNALVLWHEGRPRVIAARPELGRWLAENFVRHFTETKGLPWEGLEVTVAPVSFDLDLASGLRAAGGDVELTISGPKEVTLDGAEAYQLGDVANALTLVFVPCGDGTLSVGGVQVEGAPTSPFLTDAEVWSHLPAGSGSAAGDPA